MDRSSRSNSERTVILNSKKEDLSYRLYLELNKNYTSKCEKILHKLKLIKNHPKLENESNIQQDLIWIINTITTEDIYTPEMYTKNSLNNNQKDVNITDH